jgi:hypothetical protein
MENRQLSISYTVLRRTVLILITLPLFVFFLGWLRWYWACLSCIALAAGLLFSDENGSFVRLFKKNDRHIQKTDVTQKKIIVISKKMLISIVVFSLVYCILCGIGRLWAQSDDYNWRNAIFRDLISFDWPVIYDKFDGALSYYIAVWLPASLFGKLVLVFGGSLETAFIVGNMVLLIYFTIGLSSAFLLLLMYFGKTDTKRVCLTLLGFVLFSGMDIIGMMLGSDNWFEFMHLEWWAGFGSFQYS